MKKLLCLIAAMSLCISMTACGGKNDNTTPTYSAPPAKESNQITGENNPEVARNNENEPDGFNAASTEADDAGTKYNFEGKFSTTLPDGLQVVDSSINTDSALFTVFDNSQTYLDVTYYKEGTSEESQRAKAKNIAKSEGSKEVEALTLSDTKFYGVYMPVYGKTQYCGYINGHNVDISIYADLNDPAVQTFLQNTVFVK